MRILIVSDSHGLVQELENVIERHREEVDVVIHCGDSELKKDTEILQGVHIVQGNCDYGLGFDDEWLGMVGDSKVYVTHGHLYNVKTSYVPLSYRGEEVGADLVCFGHSHVATTFVQNNIVYVNPGSLRQPREPNIKTYCIYEKNDKEVKITYYDESGKKIDKISERYIIE